VLRHVEGADGVRIACESSGSGPPLVAVHGAGSARWSFDMLRPHLEDRFTVIAIDRRGRGDSTDGPEYSLETECDDVAAVVRDAGDGALLFGHSYGGLVAAGAAVRLGLPRLALYEPAMGGGLTSEDTIDRWERLIQGGERDTVTREFLQEIGTTTPTSTGWSRRRYGMSAAGSSRPSRASCARSRPIAWTTGASAISTCRRSSWWAATARRGRCGPWRHTRTRSRAPTSACSRVRATARTWPHDLLAAELGRFFATGSDVSCEP
jgi:pimeloyl-ACP methyl ester carboxylesterase